MPTKLFGLDFGGPRSSPQIETALSLKNKSVQSIADIRRGSMDFKRANLGLTAKKNGSRDRDAERSLSKDKHGREKPPAPSQPRPVTLGMIMESPPVLMIDSPSHSSGALISGRLQVTANAPEAVVDSISMYLECTTSTKKPVQERCRECATQVKDLYEWTFLTRPKAFRADAGVQELPFSHLIPGHLPVTTHGHIGSIEYSLHVRARSRDGQETEFRRELVIKRALRPGNDKNSVRIFPPTNLTLHVTLPNIVHPIGEFPVTCRMTGVVTRKDDTQTRWRLRKLSWRIEEHELSVSPACALHSAKLGGAGKGVQHAHSHEIGGEELRSGWKTDFAEATIEGEFTASIDGGARGPPPLCAVDAPHGTRVEHHLVLELVIAEEWASNRRPENATPTGAARVLRTQFRLAVTERAGLGIAWDDEQPPMYEDVPDSPPRYAVGSTEVASEGVMEEVAAEVEALELGE